MASASPAISVALLSALLVAVAAPAAAQTPEETTSTVTFYGHVFGFGRAPVNPADPTSVGPNPMNTQFPTGEADLSRGQVAHNCGLPGTASCEDDPVNEAWLYTTAGFVQIKEVNEFDYTKLHNERGLTKDTELDTSQDITAEFYMSADGHPWLVALCEPGAPTDFPWPVPCWQWDPGYLSQWQVEATVYTGILGEYGGAADEAPDIAAAFESGKLVPLATGVSEPVDVMSLEATGNPTVWKFDINLGKPQRDVIKKEESYLVRFQWWSLKPDGSKMVLPSVDIWNVDSGEQYPPLVRLPVKGAFNVELVLPQFVYDKLVILGVMNTPWGSYDVDQESITLAITGPDGAPVEPVRINRLADFSVAHGGHYKPVNVTYVWDYRADGLKPGEYTVTIRATNFQGSASASCTGGFTILPGGIGGDIRVGECGVRTISDERLEEIKEGSADDATAPEGGSRAPAALPVRLHSAAVTPVAVPDAGLLAFALLGVVLALRRWSP